MLASSSSSRKLSKIPCTTAELAIAITLGFLCFTWIWILHVHQELHTEGALALVSTSSSPIKQHPQQQQQQQQQQQREEDDGGDPNEYNTKKGISKLITSSRYISFNSHYKPELESRPPIIPEMLYWRDQPPQSRKDFPFQPIQQDKYLSFESDPGGFNNIRMGFEYFMTMAALTGRTVVMPQPEPWYLLDFGSVAFHGVKGGKSWYGEFFDLEDLARVVPWMTHKQFTNVWKGNRWEGDPPVGVQKREKIDQGNKWEGDPPVDPQKREWLNWLRDHSHSMAGWNPFRVVICWPTIESIANLPRDVTEHYLPGRNKVEYDESLQAKRIIHFPEKEREDIRFFGQVAAMAIYEDDKFRRAANRFRRNHIHYRPEFFYVASKVVQFLGKFNYTSMHIRRGDLQYKESKIAAEETLTNTKVMLNPHEILYVSTDEQKEFFAVFERHHPVFVFNDFFTDKGGNVLKGFEISPKVVGMIEQIICAMGRRFFGTRLSTFTAYIIRMRGYIHGVPDKNIYFHNRRFTGDAEHDQRDSRQAMRPTEWMDEYSSTWLDIN